MILTPGKNRTSVVNHEKVAVRFRQNTNASYFYAAPWSPWQTAACFALGLLISLAIGAFRFHALVQGELLNPDSYMRLVRLDEILRLHAPIDVVTRDGSGAGTVLHWSHLLDSLLLAPATPLMPWLGTKAAIRWVGIALGPLTMGCLGAALAWAGAGLSEARWRWTAAFIGCLAVPVLGYGVPGVIHHHLLAALSAVMCAGWAARAGVRGIAAGWCLGVWTAFGVWLTPEVMPLALLAFAGIGIGWMLQPDEPRWGQALAAAGTAMAVLIGLALAVDPPMRGYAQADIDRLSITWFIMAVLCAVIGWLVLSLDRLRLPPLRRGLLGAGIVACAAGLWLAWFPALLGGPEAALDGTQAQAFFASITEMQPITSVGDVFLFLLPGLFGLGLAVAFAIRQRSPYWAYIAVCAVLLLGVAILHRRFSTYATCLGAALVPVALSAIGRRYDSRAPVAAAALRLCTLVGLFLGPLAGHAMTPASEAAETAPNACNLLQAASMLAAYAGQVVLSDVNDTPELLYRTGVLTVGSLYHRDPRGFLRLLAAWRTVPGDTIPPAVLATRASLVLMCPKAVRSGMVGDLPHTTLWDRLAAAMPPPWLTEVASNAASGYVLYRIDR